VPNTKRHALNEAFDNQAVGVLKLELFPRYRWSSVPATGEPILLPVTE